MSGFPNQPSQPGQPGRPGQPSHPGHPGHPDRSDRPGEPDQPCRPQPLPLDGGQTAILLDQLVYERVLSCIDLDALYDVEQSLTVLAGDLDGVGVDRGAELARAMLDRALSRLPDDMRRYLRAVQWMECDGCVLCEEEAREAHRTSSANGQRRSPRFRS